MEEHEKYAYALMHVCLIRFFLVNFFCYVEFGIEFRCIRRIGSIKRAERRKLNISIRNVSWFFLYELF